MNYNYEIKCNMYSCPIHYIGIIKYYQLVFIGSILCSQIKHAINVTIFTTEFHNRSVKTNKLKLKFFGQIVKFEEAEVTRYPLCQCDLIWQGTHYMVILPHTPLANTDSLCLWLCSPKNTNTVHINTLAHTWNTCTRISGTFRIIQSQSASLPPSQPFVAEHALSPGSAVESCDPP